jgi:orsellinic acid C2-O-methyltransferase
MKPLDTHDEHAQLLAMLNGHWMTQAICTAANLGVPSLLAERPYDARALAAATETHERSLVRLLRYLMSLGLVAQDDGGRYTLTRTGALLDPAAPDSLHPWALLRSVRWPQPEELDRSVRTGGPGGDNFGALSNDPTAAAVFHMAMAAMTRRVAAQVLKAIPFAASETVVDVGGGSGELVTALLNAHPSMHGIVFDLDHAREGATTQFTNAGVADRCRFVAGSFFDAVPAQADTYLLKSVLHNWDDQHAARILACCRAALGASARLLIVERILPQRWSDCAEHRSAAASDLRMLVGLSGRERSALEFEGLLATAGLTIQRIVPTAGEFHVIEGVAA